MQDAVEGRRLDATLNNCSLNAGLPLLLLDIQKLAAIEARGNLPEQQGSSSDSSCSSWPEEKIADNTEISANDKIYQSYKLLKEIFSDMYEANPELTWNELNTIINKFDTFIAKQLLFLIVFRQFIGHKAQGIYDDITWLTHPQDDNPELPGETQPNGRFCSLIVTEAFHLFYSHFGISIDTYVESDDTQQSTGPWIKDENQCFKPIIQKQDANKLWYHQARLISLYHHKQSGHFEMLAESELKTATDIHNYELAILEKQLKNRWNEFSASGHAYTSIIGIIKLQYYVHSIIKSLRGENVEAITRPDMARGILQTSIESESHESTSLILLDLLNKNRLSEVVLTNILEAESLDIFFENLDSANQVLIAAINGKNKELHIQALNAGAVPELIQSFLDINIGDNSIEKGAANASAIANNLDTTNSTNRPPSYSIAFKIFTSIYAKLVMMMLMLAAALTLTALLINASYLPTSVASFILHLTPIAFDAICGASIAVGAVSAVGLITATMLSNCDSGLFCKRHGAGDELDIPSHGYNHP